MWLMKGWESRSVCEPWRLRPELATTVLCLRSCLCRQAWAPCCPQASESQTNPLPDLPQLHAAPPLKHAPDLGPRLQEVVSWGLRTRGGCVLGAVGA